MAGQDGSRASGHGDHPLTISQKKRGLGPVCCWISRTKGWANRIPSFGDSAQYRLRPEPVGEAVILGQHHIFAAGLKNTQRASLVEVQRTCRDHNLPVWKRASFRERGAKNDDLQLVTATLCFPGV